MAPRASPDQTLPAPKEKTESRDYQRPPLQTVINCFDFEKIAINTLSEKTWAFYSSGATDLNTVRDNVAIFSSVSLRPRVLRPVAKIDTSSTILGHPTSLPLFVSPAALAGLASPEAEAGIAKGAKAEGIIQTISSNASLPLEKIVGSVSSRSSPYPWFFQLYVNRDRKQTEKLLAEAVKLGVKGIFLTVDCPVAGKREADERLAHDVSMVAPISGGASSVSQDSKGGGLARMMGLWIDANLQWSDIPEIAGYLKKGQRAAGLSIDEQIPIVIKGITTAADAKKCAEYVKYGVRGIFLSNHGGRSLDTSPPALLVLLEMWKVCPNVFKNLEVYVDGGIRRGTDIVKAVSLGAKAVGLGRPFLYSNVYGAEGVQRLVDILKDEVRVTMQMLGVTSIDQLHPGLVFTGKIDHLVPGPESGEAQDGELTHPYAGQQRALKL